MSALLQKLWQSYHFLFEELADPRTKDWYFVAKPYQGLTLIFLYLMFVLKWGPSWMKHKQPYNIDKILIVYNAIQVVCCLYVFVNNNVLKTYFGDRYINPVDTAFLTVIIIIKGIIYGWGWDYKWICEPVDFTVNERSMIVARLVYNYYILKIIDLLDTVFFILRKKFNQASFLHIYHHAGMVMLTWGAVTYFPGGHGTFVGLINSFVHVIMYSYYLITVIIPSTKNSMWWKKHITQLQILQFFWTVIHMGIIVFKTDCAFPRWPSAIFLPQNLFMLILFLDFYYKSYIKKKPVSNGVHKNGLNNNVVNENTVKEHDS